MQRGPCRLLKLIYHCIIFFVAKIFHSFCRNSCDNLNSRPNLTTANPRPPFVRRPALSLSSSSPSSWPGFPTSPSWSLRRWNRPSCWKTSSPTSSSRSCPWCGTRTASWTRSATRPPSPSSGTPSSTWSENHASIANRRAVVKVAASSLKSLRRPWNLK